MSTAETLITKHLDTWTSAIKAKSSAGRGGGKKQEFYGLKKLRELILELAVRGLLVKQEANDESASELLKKVEAGKARLIKDGQIKKTNALPCVTEDEEPFQLPDRWKWVRLNELASVVRGVTYKKSDASDVETTGSVPLMRANNIGRGLNFDDLIHIPRSLVNPDQLIIKGDLLIAMSSGSPALVGKAAQSDKDLNYSFGAFCAVIRAYSPILFEYFRIFFETPFYRGQTQEIGKGIGIQNLNKGALEALLIPVPSASAMSTIVAKVDELMALCDQLEQQQEDSTRTHATLVETLLGALTSASERGAFAEAWQRIADHFDTLFTTESSIDQLKQTILQLAVMGKLVEQDRGEESVLNNNLNKRSSSVGPFEIPKAWTWTELHKLSEINGGFAFKSTEYNDEGMRVIRISDFDEFGFKDHKVVRHAFSPELEKFTLAENDILMAMTGGTVGKSYLVRYLPEPMIVNQRVATIKVSKYADPSYIDITIKSEMTQAVIRKAKNSTNDNISMAEIKGFAIPLPPLAEQHRIVAKVDELVALCDHLKSKLQVAQTTQLHLADTLSYQAAI